MISVLVHADGLLRESARPTVDTTAIRIGTRRALVLILCFAPLYGATMGSFAFDSPERIWMVVFAAVKIPLLLGATTFVCLPGFFVVNTILGLRDDFRDALAAIFAGQAGLSIALASLAPFTRFYYFSTTDYQWALLFNAMMFAIGTVAAQIVMFRRYRVLRRRNPLHAVGLWAWVLLYSFVGIQMGWVLRPFVGDPSAPVTFFRQDPFSNAYVVVAGLIARLLG